MKKFAVLKKVGTFGAEVEREFDDIDDALNFEVLMTKTEDNAHVSYTTVANVSFWGSEHFRRDPIGSRCPIPAAVQPAAAL